MRILLSYAYKPYTTAVYYERAFKAFGHEVWRCEGTTAAVTNMGWQPNLFVWIESGGGIHPDWLRKGIPTIAYYIDSHTQRGWHVEDAKRYDHVFVSDIRYVGEYGPNAHWLPMACDPDLHTPTRTEPPEYDVAFVGNTYPGSPLYEDRRQTLAALAKRYKCRFESGVYFQDMANVYASAKVVFNKSVAGELNMRVFEGMCSGRPLVTDAVTQLSKPFLRDGALFGELGLAYMSDDGAMMAIDGLLENPEHAAQIGAAGRAEVLAYHTYAHRAAQMLAEAGL